MTIAGLVLSGGLSRRMGGGEKGLRPLGGRPMIAHVIERLAPQVGPLAINANADPGLYAGFGLPVVPDIHPGFAGPLAGVLTGLDWAAALPEITHVATAAVDTPFFPRDLVARMSRDLAPGRIVLARSPEGRHPVFGLWPVDLRDDLARWLASGGTLKVQAWAARHDLAFADFAPVTPDAPDPFFNTNTPEDLARAETYLEQRP
ncbi:molybdopterin-guanine dinucleotide biosynthesis protein A [Defluviimonas sp. 20V17]|uniref:Molybdenum cofactor guanylyltransferase n=1 Tax=Allgaiera indica TaxID=765699 RepID=A0AAN5A0L3_9RHOB|nr:molybdenum cofactor guanylyltransferase MobA [Allgaiera indica]KDB01755.1 molybdopterin-guanine dinucleotide biosynthesis protein A [Defluviimonas sp. 20V17]GHE02527.1 molybdenum cofactor guanylyltransferase [Allgaiera indica]SDX28444.1 molybdenum cofactor guanylyltransferase [Allgaiera indica]